MDVNGTSTDNTRFNVQNIGKEEAISSVKIVDKKAWGMHSINIELV